MTLTEVQHLLDEAWSLRDTNRQQATQLLDRANQYLVEQENVGQTVIESAQLQIVLGFFLFRDARFEAAIQCLQHALTVLDNSDAHRWMARGHGTLGVSLVFSGMSKGATASIKKQIMLAEQLGDTVQLGMAHQSLSWIYMQQEAYTEAAEALQQAIRIHKQLGLHFQTATSLANLASCYIYLDQAAMAQAALDESMWICKSHGFDLISYAAIQSDGFLEAGQDVLSNRSGYFDRTLGVVEQMDDSYSVVRALIRSGQIYTDCHGREKALNCLHKALGLAHELQARELIYTIHQQLANSYELFGDYKLALEQHRLYHRSRESVFIEQSELRVQTLQMQHVTESAQREAAWLQSQNVMLEQQVATRTAKLEATTVQLKKAHADAEAFSKLKSQIISTVSHEFRTPMTTIHSSTELLIQHLDKLSPEKRRQIGERVRTSIHYLTNLLQNVELVDVTENKNFWPQMRSTSFSSLWHDLASNFTTEISNASRLQFEFDAAEQRTITVDSSILKQVISRLLANALQYSPAGTPVTLRAWIHADQMFVSVQDQGIGILEGEEAHIWDLLYRGSNVETRRGLGLGLFIACQLVQVLGGNISVDSAGADQGACFTVCYPLPLIKQIYG